MGTTLDNANQIAQYSDDTSQALTECEFTSYDIKCTKNCFYKVSGENLHSKQLLKF